MVRVLLFATIFLLLLQTGSTQGDLVETLNDQFSPTHRALPAGGDQSTSSRRLTGTKDSEFIRAGHDQQTEGVQVQSEPPKDVEALKAQIMAAVAVEDYHEAAKLKDLLDTLQITPFGSDKTENQNAAKTAARGAVEQKKLRGDVPMTKMADFGESDDDEDEDEWLKNEESGATHPSLRRVSPYGGGFNQSSMFWYKDWKNSGRREALVRKAPNRALQSLIMLDNENERRNGACPSPPSLGRLSEGLPPGTDPELLKVLVAINAFDVGLSAYEAPIALRFASLIVNTWWNCIAVFSDTFKDAFTNERPGVVVSGLPYEHVNRRRVRGNTAYRSDAGAHAVTFMAEHLIDNTVDDVIGGLTSIGVSGCARGINNRLKPCGHGDTLDLACLQSVVDAAVGEHILWRGNGCGSESSPPGCAARMSHHKFTRLVGQAVALQTVAFAITDGWNQFGKDDGKCDVNCQPFKDTTSFRKKNGDTKWRAMKEDNGMGFFFQHRHVTPHIGAKGKLRFLSEQDRTDRVAPDPNYDDDRKKESDAVIARMLTLDDRKKVEIETFDSKLYTTNMVIAAFLPKCAMHFDDVSVLQSPLKYGTPGTEIYCSYERLVHFVITLINSEYDAAIIVWKEKVRYNLVRPTTVIKRRKDEVITTWSLNVPSSQFKARNFEAYKRVMPHAEYPSGSSCMCQTLADSGREYLKKFECGGIALNAEIIDLSNAPTKSPTKSPTMSANQMACSDANCQECLHEGKSPFCHRDGKGDSAAKCVPESDHIWCGDFEAVTQLCSVGKHVTAAWPGNAKYYPSTITRIIEEDGMQSQVEVRWDDDSSLSTIGFHKVHPACSISTNSPTKSPTNPAISSTSESATENGTPLNSALGLVNDGSSMTSISMPVTRVNNQPFQAGKSSVEKGVTPARDILLSYPSVDQMAHACSQSRLDGGMHFTAAVSSGEDLCKGIGNLGVEWAYNLLGVFSDPTDEEKVYRCATATCSANQCADCRTGGCAAGCSYCSQNCVSGSNKW